MMGLGAAVASGMLSGGLHALALRASWGWLVAWVALVPILVALARTTPRRAMGAAMAYAATLGLAEIAPWLVPALRRYFSLDPGVALALGLVGLALVSLAHGAVLGAVVALRLRARGRLGVVWCAACWSAWEALRPFVPPFFPACVLGTSQAAVPSVLQIASVTGVAGVTALVVAVNAALAELIAAPASRRRTVTVAGTIAVVAIVVVWGAGRIARAPLVPADAPTVVLVDGGATQAGDSTLDRYVAATPRGGDAPTLVVWPESAIPDDLAFDRAAWLRLSAFVDELGTTLATGAVGSAVRSDGGIIRFNSVHVIRPRHGMLSYHKRLPVPLAESWPAALGAPPPSLDPVAAGRELVVFDVGTTRFGSLICFEIADAPSARALAARGARFIVNVTNDVWFAGGRAPHEVWVIVRAVESGRPVVRAPNLGTAAIVDPFGRAVTSARATGGPAVLAGAIPDPVDTVYVRTGEVFLPLCLVVVGAGLLPRRRRVIPPGSMAG